MTHQKIVPHLWFDREAKEAANLYSSVFPNSSITRTSTLHNTPLGDCEVVSFTVFGHPFMSISAGPMFKFNPSISFMVNFDPSQVADAKTRIDDAWTKLADGGKCSCRSPSTRSANTAGLWIRFGVSWQLILTNPEGEERPIIIPSLLFVGDVCGKAEEASDFSISVFKDAMRGEIARYLAGMEPNKEGTVMFTNFMLEGLWFAAMDSAQQHNFAFNEAISFMVYCNDQSEIDYTGTSFLLFRQPSNAAGSRTSMVSHGRSSPLRWTKCWRIGILRERPELPKPFSR